MEWILLAIGLVVGGGAGFGITWKLVSKSQTEAPQVIIVEDKTAEKQQDVIMQLTDLDLVKPVCNPTFIQAQKLRSLVSRMDLSNDATRDRCKDKSNRLQ